MDQNKPARFLDTAYTALKGNPNATNQIMQAAAKGAPVGLKGLAAAAAQQNQQDAQKAMMAQHVQGPQPSVIQKLASANMPGIMGQLPSNLQLASAPTGPAPEQMPQQMMATGGLVSFADGGNVLPPDVIEAIQSHFAYGGDVRGFAKGDEIMALMRGAPEDLPYGEMGSFIEGPGATPRSMPADYGPMGSFVEGAPREMPSKLDALKKLFASRKSPFMTEAQKDVLANKINWNMIEGGGEAFPSVPKAVSELAGKAKPVGEFLGGKLFMPAAILSDPVLQAATKAHTGLAKAVAGSKDAFSESPVEKAAYHLPELAGKGMDALLSKIVPTGEVNEAISKEDWEARKVRPVPVTDTTPASEPSHTYQENPRTEVHPEGQKVSQEFGSAKQETNSAATPKDQGLGNLDQGKEMVDYIKSLYGEKKMDPEIAKKLEDLQDSARTSTIFQSILGGLAGGLSNPYGGRFALGSAALNALGGYQKGSAGEDEISRKALDIERAYADQPAEMQTAAAKEYFDLMKEKAKMLSAQHIAEGRALSREEYAQAREAERLANPFVHGAGAYAGITTPIQQEQMINMRRDDARKEIEDRNKERTWQGLNALTEQEKLAIYAQYGVTPYPTGQGGLGGGQLGAGAAPTGRSIIGGKLTGSSPQ